MADLPQTTVPGTDSRPDRLQPFHTSGPVSPSSGRLLLLTYHFPPSSETGALRWEAMVHYARDWQWEVDVVTREPGLIDEKGLRRLQQLPAGCRVFGAADRPSRLVRAEDAIRRLRRPATNGASAPQAGDGESGGSSSPKAWKADEVAALPLSLRQLKRTYFAWREFEIQKPWVDAALQVARTLAVANHYQAIVTCGPPHLIHTAGAALSRETGLPLVMDLRDPWSLQQVLPDFRASRTWYQLAESNERNAVSRASLISLNTEPCRNAMQARYPAKAAAMIVATNGYDEREAIPPSPPRDGSFRITYAGSLYFVYEHPLPFFRGVARLIQEFNLRPGQVAVEFIGHSEHYEGEPMRHIAASAGVDGFFTGLPHLPRREVLPLLGRASVLVSLAQFNDFAIPSKIFDYMRFPAWLLAVARSGTATEMLLRGTTADLVERNDEQLIHQALRKRYLEFQQGIAPLPIAPSTTSSRREQATLFFDGVRGVTSSSKAQ